MIAHVASHVSSKIFPQLKTTKSQFRSHSCCYCCFCSYSSLQPYRTHDPWCYLTEPRAVLNNHWWHSGARNLETYLLTPPPELLPLAHYSGPVPNLYSLSHSGPGCTPTFTICLSYSFIFLINSDILILFNFYSPPCLNTSLPHPLMMASLHTSTKKPKFR